MPPLNTIGRKGQHHLQGLRSLLLDYSGQELPLEPVNADLDDFFGCCQERADQDAANIEQLVHVTESLAEDVFKLQSDVNDNFFMVATELAALKSVQNEMLEIQNRIWKVIREHLESFEQQIHVLRDCDQLLFSQQQIIFIYDTSSSVLVVIRANIKSYRSAVYTYRNNMMNSLQPMLNYYLLMSLVPRQWLLRILDTDALEKGRVSNSLILAIPIVGVLAYYESALLRDIIVAKQ